jgi:hypothetical protein
MSDFHGRPAGILENSHLRLEYLTQAGPRIVKLTATGSEENLFGEYLDMGWDTPQGFFELIGGHRLWAAPEVPGVSYLPDSEGLVVQEIGAGVKLSWDPGAGKGLAMAVQVSLLPDGPKVHVTHTVINQFEYPVRAAPWGITVFPLGGKAYLPTPTTGNGLEPDRSVVLWPYARWDDARLEFNAAGIVVSGEVGMPPLKVGTFVRNGSCAYMHKGTLFIKHLEPAPGEYPDLGCNAEVYCSDRLIELETIAPLTDIMPGGMVSTTETWEILAGEQATQKLTEIFLNGGRS